MFHNSKHISCVQALEEAGAAEGVTVEMVHRKINLQEDTQAWEHEKFSMRRLPAFTLSRLQVGTVMSVLFPLAVQILGQVIIFSDSSTVILVSWGIAS